MIYERLHISYILKCVITNTSRDFITENLEAKDYRINLTFKIPR